MLIFFFLLVWQRFSNERFSNLFKSTIVLELIFHLESFNLKYFFFFFIFEHTNDCNQTFIIILYKKKSDKGVPDIFNCKKKH